jgi:hypothetical protein
MLIRAHPNVLTGVKPAVQKPAGRGADLRGTDPNQCRSGRGAAAAAGRSAGSSIRANTGIAMECANYTDFQHFILHKIKCITFA